MTFSEEAVYEFNVAVTRQLQEHCKVLTSHSTETNAVTLDSIYIIMLLLVRGSMKQRSHVSKCFDDS